MRDIKPKNVNFSSQANSRDFYKGTSFRWAGSWELGKLYTNDTYFVDFISYDGSMWVCIKSHYASANTIPSNSSEYWQAVVDNSDMKGPQGEKGEKGDPGVDGKSAYEVWKETTGSEGTEEDFLGSLKGEQGEQGEQGVPAIHVGPEAPTEAEYGPDYQNILWLQTGVSTDNTYKVYSAEDADAKFAEKSDLENYYTESEVNDLLANIDCDVDLSEYYTKEETGNLYLSKEQVESIIIEGDELT